MRFNRRCIAPYDSEEFIRECVAKGIVNRVGLACVVTVLLHDLRSSKIGCEVSDFPQRIVGSELADCFFQLVS